jgi:hypothetical protein
MDSRLGARTVSCVEATSINALRIICGKLTHIPISASGLGKTSARISPCYLYRKARSAWLHGKGTSAALCICSQLSVDWQ